MKKICTLLIIVFAALATRADEGMWLLSLLNKNIDTMRAMGYKLGAEDIYSVNQACLKDAVVGLGRIGRPFSHFCSGEIISPKGLVMTNHHCAFSLIQEQSTLEHDYLSNGFWAYKQAEEISNPGVSASILQRIEDVTDRVNALLNDNMSEAERAEAIATASKAITREAVNGQKLHAQVQPMFEGNQFFLFVYKIYLDIRLVGAPPQSMGKFGGDTDNWMWPRHTADFSLLRIYAGPDGEPAPYSASNVPLQPRHFFPVSAKGVQDGDFAMVMGFPGSTDHFLTSFGLEETVEVTNTIRHEARTEILRVMKAGMNADPKTRIQYAAKYAQCANYWKYSREQNIALENLRTMEAKQQVEQEFTRWVNADPARVARYGKALELIRDGYETRRDAAVARAYLAEALFAPELPRLAYEIGGAMEMILDPEAKEENKTRVKEQLKIAAGRFFKDFNAEIDENLAAGLFALFRDRVDAAYWPDVFQLVQKKYKGNFKKYARDMYAKTIFANPEKLYAFIDNPTRKILDSDPCLKAGRSARALYMNLNEQTGQANKDIDKGSRLFVDGLMKMNPDKAWSPDANSTIRLTYGKVGSYRPKDGVIYDYYTTLAGVMEKEGPAGGEFEVSPRLKELYAARDFSPYGQDYLATCFITNNDITGGNSGSPVINANGELIGVAFDGNSEAMSGDIDFEENLQRCINVDTRYVLFVIDKIAGAKNLLEEITIVY
ncbi:MAG: S46 family peptidase [Odoribacteraceae bacterium]|jgi:hypothetical protein|nr:S46 family peptidase [Odoribacteraceae bacterium]